ncbi:hypothetical protein Efla_002317 [Eimeria flavescens]
MLVVSPAIGGKQLKGIAKASPARGRAFLPVTVEGPQVASPIAEVETVTELRDTSSSTRTSQSDFFEDAVPIKRSKAVQSGKEAVGLEAVPADPVPKSERAAIAFVKSFGYFGLILLIGLFITSLAPAIVPSEFDVAEEEGTMDQLDPADADGHERLLRSGSLVLVVSGGKQRATEEEGFCNRDSACEEGDGADHLLAEARDAEVCAEL